MSTGAKRAQEGAKECWCQGRYAIAQLSALGEWALDADLEGVKQWSPGNRVEGSPGKGMAGVGAGRPACLSSKCGGDTGSRLKGRCGRRSQEVEEMGRDGEENRGNSFVSLVRTSAFHCGETGASQGRAAKRGLVDLAPCTPCSRPTGA